MKYVKIQKTTSWWQPDEVVEDSDPEFGPVTVRIWHGLRYRKALDCKMLVARVERRQAPGTRRKPKVLWFAWVGEPPPPRWWLQSARRYPIDHWYRFAKGRLHWILPQFATPQPCDRWSDLMPYLTWKLWLARAVVQGCPLPWQKPQDKLSPGRVCQGMQNLLVTIGTPTRMCKSHGKAPGWPTGKPRARQEWHNLLISAQWERIREGEKKRKA